jgi:hypothetical protein
LAKALIGIAPLLFNNGLEEFAHIGGANGFDCHGRYGRKQLSDFLGVGDFGVVFVGVCVDKSEHDARLQ